MNLSKYLQFVHVQNDWSLHSDEFPRKRSHRIVAQLKALNLSDMKSFFMSLCHDFPFPRKIVRYSNVSAVTLNYSSSLLSFQTIKNVGIVNPNLLSMNEDALTHLILYGNNVLTDDTNAFLLNYAVEYITSTKRLTIFRLSN